jgi:hypothetical protein
VCACSTLAFLMPIALHIRIALMWKPLSHANPKTRRIFTMRPKALFYLLTLTLLIGTTLLNTSEALCQTRIAPAPPVVPPTITRPVTIPSISTPTSIPKSPTLDTRSTIPQTNVPTAPQSTQSTGGAATSGSPPPDTAKSDDSGGDGTPTPTPEITPTVTPPQLSTPTPTPSGAGGTSSAYRTPPPSPPTTPSPTSDNSIASTSSGPWWLWLVMVGIIMVSFYIWVTRRALRRLNGRNQVR